MDFVSDALVNKRKIRVLTAAAAAILDDCSREVLAAHADFSLPVQKVIDVLELIAMVNHTLNKFELTMGRSSLPINSVNGVKIKASRSTIFSQENQCKMGMWKD